MANKFLYNLYWIHHLKTIDVIDRQHKLFANRIIDKYNFNTKKLDVKELEEIEVVCKNEISYNNVALQIAEQLSELPEKEILDFKNNKFDIFMKVARSRNYQKKFEEVKGAAILRK